MTRGVIINRYGSAETRWRSALEGWRVPPDILERAPENPWRFPPSLFKTKAGQVHTISFSRALEALPQGGSVLDVGCGGGAASIPLSSRAGLLIGVDESSEMLESFAAAALENHVPHREIHGRWPDIAEKVPAADVVLCHHVFYNVPDLTRFVTALDSHARRRVVVELTAAHPNVPLAPLWRRFHKLERPAGPTVEDAVEVLREAALSPRVETWRRPPRVRDPQERAQTVAFIRRRLCLSWEFDEEIDRLLGSIEEVMPRDVATLWWDASPRNNASK